MSAHIWREERTSNLKVILAYSRQSTKLYLILEMMPISFILMKKYVSLIMKLKQYLEDNKRIKFILSFHWWPMGHGCLVDYASVGKCISQRNLVKPINRYRRQEMTDRQSRKGKQGWGTEEGEHFTCHDSGIDQMWESLAYR